MAKWKQAFAALLIAFGIALSLNWAILKLFGQNSADRAEHNLVGIIFLMTYVSILKEEKKHELGLLRFFFIALIPCYFGTVFPDLDITLFGIGGHRNPIFHSCISYFVLLLFIGRKNIFFHTLIIGYGIGLSSHLLWDVIYYGDVRWLPGGTIDRIWLCSNGVLSLIPLKIIRFKNVDNL